MYQVAKAQNPAAPRKLTKKDWYEVVVRRNYYLPSSKCPLVTLGWLKAVGQG